jgi:hypothetical protein
MVGCHDQLAMHQNKHCFKNMISLDVLFCFTGVVTARVLLRLVLSTRSQYPGNFHFSSFLTQSLWLLRYMRRWLLLSSKTRVLWSPILMLTNTQAWLRSMHSDLSVLMVVI